MSLGSGEVFAGYTIVRLLGSGGMGEVYLARHPRLPRSDALKVLRANVSSDNTYRQRFIREADSVAALEHPNIVTVHDRGETGGKLWIAMQYVDGVNAAQYLRRHPRGMSADEVAQAVTAVAQALDYAHDHGVLHRDVKPANILLAEPDCDGVRRIYLADFGIARPVDDPSGLTATNFTLGTVAFAAPEQLMGADLDGRADQYALAATAYNLLTGAAVFPDSNPIAVISRHLTDAPPPPSSIDPKLAAFDAVFSRALAKNPHDRFARCRDFAREFVQAAAASGVGSPPAPTQDALVVAARPGVENGRTAPAGGRRRSVHRWLGVAVAALVLGIVTAVLLWQPWQAPDNPAAAASSSASPSARPPAANVAPPATKIVKVVAVNAKGQPINGFQEVPPVTDLTLGSCSTSTTSLDAGVFSCSPLAAMADTCWPAPQYSMLCLEASDLWNKILRRYSVGTPPSQTTPGHEPRPLGLLLDDGTRCTLSEARKFYPRRDDGSYPAYDCGGAGAVLTGPNTDEPTIDRAQPLWTVRIGQVGPPCGIAPYGVCPNFPDPQTHTVTTAWFAGT